jgi:hypothetical protein
MPTANIPLTSLTVAIRWENRENPLSSRAPSGEAVSVFAAASW